MEYLIQCSPLSIESSKLTTELQLSARTDELFSALSWNVSDSIVCVFKIPMCPVHYTTLCKHWHWKSYLSAHA